MLKRTLSSKCSKTILVMALLLGAPTSVGSDGINEAKADQSSAGEEVSVLADPKELDDIDASLQVSGGGDAPSAWDSSWHTADSPDSYLSLTDFFTALGPTKNSGVRPDFPDASAFNSKEEILTSTRYCLEWSSIASNERRCLAEVDAATLQMMMEVTLDGDPFDDVSSEELCLEWDDRVSNERRCLSSISAPMMDFVSKALERSIPQDPFAAAWSEYNSSERFCLKYEGGVGNERRCLLVVEDRLINAFGCAGIAA